MNRGVTRGAQFPGCRITTGVQKVPAVSQVLSSIVYIYNSQKTLGSNIGAPNLLLATRRHLTSSSLRPCTWERRSQIFIVRMILTSQIEPNFLEYWQQVPNTSLSIVQQSRSSGFQRPIEHLPGAARKTLWDGLYFEITSQNWLGLQK